jgi:hypothetical protein
MQISITVDFSTATRQIADIHRRQIPFAIARTLTALAHEARRHIVEVAGPRDFRIRNKRFLGVAMRVQAATKDNLVATIYDQLGRDYLTTQAMGGIKTPRGRTVAIPSEEFLAKRKSTGVPKSMRPKALARSFRVRSRGQDMILVRTGRGKRSGVKLAYVLERQAQIPKRWMVFEDTERLVKRRAELKFAASMARAITTAR